MTHSSDQSRDAYPGWLPSRISSRFGAGGWSRMVRRLAADILLLAAAAANTGCINTEAETLYEDVEITRKDELPADTAREN